MAFALITPSSRGIGLALTREVLRCTPSDMPVIATARTDLEGARERILADLSPSSSSSSSSSSSPPPPSTTTTPRSFADRLDVVRCDLESESSIADLAWYIRSRYSDSSSDRDRSPRDAPHLRLLFCVPGMLVPERAPSKILYETALQTLRLNVLAPMMVAKHVVPLLPRKSTPDPSSSCKSSSSSAAPAVLAFMSARVGSISDNARGGWYSYRASKAALNQFVKTLDAHVRLRAGARAFAVGLHPGTVRTDLSREFWDSTPRDKLFEPEFAAQRLLEVVWELGRDVERARGRCWDWKGEEILP